jgi:hypothetical protein
MYILYYYYLYNSYTQQDAKYQNSTYNSRTPLRRSIHDSLRDSAGLFPLGGVAGSRHYEPKQRENGGKWTRTATEGMFISYLTLFYTYFEEVRGLNQCSGRL